MGILLVYSLEQVVGKHTHAQRTYQEQQCAPYHAERICRRILEAYDECEHDYAYHIIYYGSAHDKGAYAPFKVPQLLQGLHCYAYGGGSHDGAHEDTPHKLLCPEVRKTVERPVQQRTPHKRDEHPHKGYKQSLGAGFQQLPDIGAKPCLEHYHYHAYLRNKRQIVALLHDAEDTGPQQQAAYYLPHHRGGFQLLCPKPHEL